MIEGDFHGLAEAWDEDGAISGANAREGAKGS